MTFISSEFVIFFAVVSTLYFLIPQRWRWALLLVAGYYFYGRWQVSYLLLLVFTTVVDFFAASQIARTDPSDRRRRRMFLALSVGTNLTVLFIFKYFNFFAGSIADVLGALGIHSTLGTLNVLLPIGISFYTFQSIAYTVDVYRGSVQAERHFGIYAAFVAFFPLLVAGPIERAPHILPQFRRRHDFVYARIVDGLRLMLWGAFKKVVIADRIAIYVNAVYADPTLYSGEVLIMATLFFTFQIYCDFSGYSDIAIGVAKVLGFDVMLNFRQPYFSRTVREFWARWHISLSTWFRDYLYIPLGGSRVTIGRNILNLMIVFVVSGLWHGANWTFFIWGFLHGLYIAVETLLRHFRVRILPANLLGNALRWLVTFVLVVIAWVFFRAATIDEAFYVLSHWLSPAGETNVLTPFQGRTALGGSTEFWLSLALIAVLIAIDLLDARLGLNVFLNRVPRLARWTLYVAAMAGIILTIALTTSGSANFIYFQF